mgnify:CR=1 FL=1|jgi:hypothetical protein
MTARKTPAKAAAKQPEAKAPGTEQSTATETGQPSKERGPAKDGTSSGVELEVVTRLERRIRAGVVVTRDPRTVTVTEDVAEALEADPHITVRRA